MPIPLEVDSDALPVDVPPIEHLHCSGSVRFRPEKSSPKSSGLAIVVRRDIRTNDQARGSKQIFQILPLHGKRQIRDEHDPIVEVVDWAQAHSLMRQSFENNGTCSRTALPIVMSWIVTG